jgi:GNAT superfamily N-acetyltransferase
MAEITYTDSGFSVDAFLALAERVWPREYDRPRAGASDGAQLVGAVRVLTDGYFFAAVAEILDRPDYQRRGIGRTLMERALSKAPRGTLFLGARPEAVPFFERFGYEGSLTLRRHTR